MCYNGHRSIKKYPIADNAFTMPSTLAQNALSSLRHVKAGNYIPHVDKLFLELNIRLIYF